MKKIILLISLLTLSMSTFSQVPIKGDGLSGEDFEKVATEIKKKVKDFQRSVGHLAGNEYNHKEKEDIRKRTLDWFIGAGERYPLAVPTRNGFDTTWHNAVTMGIAPTKRDKSSRVYKLMKDYLSNLINDIEKPNRRYNKVVIEGAEVVTIDYFRKIGDDSYIATAHYLQKYSGYRSADMVRAAYTDYSAKTVTVFINITSIEQHDGSVERYAIIKLGDVDCDEVW